MLNGEEKNSEYRIFDNKREEFIDYAWVTANEMVRNISQGEVIKDEVDDQGERIIVTMTEKGTYGYQVIEFGDTKPHYYAESHFLLEDLNKKTDSDGRALRYSSAKSRIQRNLIGIFSEYILDEGFHSYYINIKFPLESEVQVCQKMTGYDRQDPVVLLSASFDSRRFSIAADAQIIGVDNHKYVRFGLGRVKDDGTIDYDLTYKMAKEGEMAKKFLGEPSMSSARLKEVIEDSVREAQALLYSVYKRFDLPIMDGVVPNNMLTEQINMLLQEAQPNNKKIG